MAQHGYKRRMDVAWNVIGECTNHMYCDCTLRVMIRDVRFDKFEFVVSRMAGKYRRTSDDMYFFALAQIAAVFGYSEHILTRHNMDVNTVLKSIMLNVAHSKNMVKIPPFILHNVVPKSVGLFPSCHPILMAYRAWDLRYFSKLGIDIMHNNWVNYIWKDAPRHGIRGLPWKTDRDPVPEGEVAVDRVPSLKTMLMQRLSVYNTTFTGGDHGEYTVCTLDGLYPNKLYTGLQRHDMPTRDANTFAKSLYPLIVPAITMMQEYMGTDKFLSIYDYDPYKDRSDAMPTTSSSGLRSGESRIEMGPDGIRRTYSTTGKKIEQRTYILRQHRSAIDAALKGDILENPDPASMVTPKVETANSSNIQDWAGPWNKSIKMSAFLGKYRNFMIGFGTNYLDEQHVCGLRQKLERGKMIRIGQKWWHGGAQEFFSFLKGEDPDMVFGDGDVENFDNAVHRVLMEIYMSQSGVYYNFNDPITKKAYYIMLRRAIKTLTARITHLYGNEWRVIYGGMPSGVYSTSHGDSWILGFLFWLFVCHVMHCNPSIRKKIRVLFKDGKIVIVVYGDDHIIGVHRSIHSMISEEKFAEFIGKFFDMKTKDVRNDVNFLSIPNDHGTLNLKGIVFLQRYFIGIPSHFTAHPRMPQVYPYRPITKYYWKLPFGGGEKRSVVDLMMACIGNVYDTMGTNRLAYEFFLFMFMILKKISGITDIRKHFLARLNDLEERDLIKLLNKSGISLEDILEGFPTLHKLENMHMIDTEYTHITQYEDTVAM